ncbi:Aldehyde/histidinol dehydrogenase [Lipomyces starkeyi]
MTKRLVPLIIDREDRVDQTAPRFDVIQAASGKVLHQAQGANVDLAKEAVDRAAVAFTAWKEVTPATRREHFTDLVRILKERSREIVHAMATETSCATDWCEWNIENAINLTEELGALATSSGLSGSIPPTTMPNSVPLTFNEPIGVVLGIVPWNAPILLGIRAVLTPIAVGCTALFKASEFCPLTHYLLVRAITDAFPPGVVGLIHHSAEDAPVITKLGRRIAAVAGENLKPVLLELGGKNAFLLDADADIEAAVDAVMVGGILLNYGQICMSTDRLFVHEDVYDQVVNKLKAMSVELPELVLASSRGLDRVKSLLLDAKTKGANITGGDISRASIRPAIVERVVDGMSIHTEESFGPVVIVYKVSSMDEAIKLANESEYGLSASVWTKNIGRGLAIARKIETGAVHVNHMSIHDEPTLPHGGVKSSGWGRFGAEWGLREFVQTKTVTLHGITM